MRRVGETVRCEGAPLGVGTGEDRYHVGRYETEEEAAATLRAEQERRQRAELEDPIGWRLWDARWVNFGSGPDEMAGSVE